MLNKDIHGFHAQSWQQAIHELTQASCPYVLVTLLGTAGSTPRATGSKMVVAEEHIFDTVGGGHLEFKIIERARELLANGNEAQLIEHFSLGANLGQCCGGSVTVLFEPIVEQVQCIDLYGAGHVGHALVSILASLPVKVRWIDSRTDLFPATLPANVSCVVDEEPEQQVKLAPKNSIYVILTHNHQLDFSITEAVLKRDDCTFLGVIGSDTKAKRFQMRLEHKGLPQTDIERMICPIGLPNIQGKLPMEVAVSIAGQLMQIYQKSQTQKPQREGLQWQQIKSQLTLESSES